MDDIKQQVESTTSSRVIPSMQTFEALQIIEKLSEGINPLSEEALAPSSLCLDSDIQRALQVAILALESRVKWIEKQALLPANAGKPWKTEEEISLTDSFDKGDSVDMLAERHQRTKGSITARLIKTGRISA
ncbi:hypothetical protein [Psychrobacter sp.]|uniref:hypothetical protein n=1 Tax=Psychrobacter sp. TaxID=56811 RepID=UPI0025E68AC4|nr:hypothetical protein [Psychrobacter sp.]